MEGEGNVNDGINTRNWMSRVDDDVKVTKMSIPGTHHSAANTASQYILDKPWTACQVMDIKDQGRDSIHSRKIS